VTKTAKARVRANKRRRLIRWEIAKGLWCRIPRSEYQEGPSVWLVNLFTTHYPVPRHLSRRKRAGVKW